MKAIKVIFGVVVAVALVMVVVSVFVLSNLNDLVKQAIEEVGTDVLGTPVTLREVDIQLKEAKGSLRGLAIQNPQGFSNNKLIEMDEILLDLDIASLQDKLVIVQQVKVDGAKLLAEQKGSNTNLQALKDHLDQGQDSAPSSPQSDQGSSTSDVLLRIDRFDFTNASTRMISDQLGETDLNLPDIQVTKIGGTKGLPPEQIASALIKPILDSLKKNMEGLLKSLAEKRIREEIEKQEAKAREKLKDKEDELKAKLEEKLGGEEKLDALKDLF